MMLVGVGVGVGIGWVGVESGLGWVWVLSCWGLETLSSKSRFFNSQGVQWSYV